MWLTASTVAHPPSFQSAITTPCSVYRRKDARCTLTYWNTLWYDITRPITFRFTFLYQDHVSRYNYSIRKIRRSDDCLIFIKKNYLYAGKTMSLYWNTWSIFYTCQWHTYTMFIRLYYHGPGLHREILLCKRPFQALKRNRNRNRKYCICETISPPNTLQFFEQQFSYSPIDKLEDLLCSALYLLNYHIFVWCMC